MRKDPLQECLARCLGQETAASSAAGGSHHEEGTSSSAAATCTEARRRRGEEAPEEGEASPARAIAQTAAAWRKYRLQGRGSYI